VPLLDEAQVHHHDDDLYPSVVVEDRKRFTQHLRIESLFTLIAVSQRHVGRGRHKYIAPCFSHVRNCFPPEWAATPDALEAGQQSWVRGPHGRIKAEIFAKAAIVLGEVVGNITASEKVDIRDNGSVDGNIVSPRVAIAEGAHFRGSVDMQRKAETAKPAGAGAGAPEAKTVAPTAPAKV